MAEREKFIEVPQNVRYPKIQDSYSQEKILHNTEIVLRNIRDKALDYSFATEEQVEDALNKFREIVLNSVDGFCKINWQVYASRYKDNKEVTFNDVYNNINNAYKKVMQFKSKQEEML